MRHRYNAGAAISGSSQVIVPPQEPSREPQPVLRSVVSDTAVTGGLVTQVTMDPVTISARGTTGPPTKRWLSRIETDYAHLLFLANSLERLARDEIAQLSGERPNDPYTIESNKKQCDLLCILADGFAKITAALIEYAKQPQPLLAGKAKEIVDEVAAQFKLWWKKNASEATDWLVRIPTLTASIAALGLAGADMTFATVAVGALVGGPKVITAIKRTKRTKRTKRR
jgi:hypothetical protein